MKTSTFIWILILLIFYSCEKEYPFHGKLPNPQLVIYSFIEPDSTIDVYVSQTRGIGQNDSVYTAHQVSGEIFINDQYIAPLSQVKENRYTTGIKADKGDHIRLVVRAKNGKEVCAETTIPTTSPIISIDTQALFTENQSKVYLRIEETDSQQKFYRFISQDCSESITYNHTWDITSFSRKIVYDDFQKDNEPLLTDQSNNLLPGYNDDANIYNIFTNYLFQGKSYILNIDKTFAPSYEYEIHSLKEDKTGIQRITNHYSLKMCQLNEDTYLYLRSVALISESSGLFTDPVKVYSNVKNGLGVVGGFTTTCISFTGPIQKLAPVMLDESAFYLTPLKE